MVSEDLLKPEFRKGLELASKWLCVLLGGFTMLCYTDEKMYLLNQKYPYVAVSGFVITLLSICFFEAILKKIKECQE